MSKAPPKDAEKQAADPSSARSIPKVGSGDVVIAARRLSLWYGAVIGINDISIDIGSGVIGLLGPNGAGKSTFMKVITGQLRPSTGTVAIGGQIVWNHPAAMSQIGFVPEQDSFYEDMTGREFVTYLTRLQGFSAADAADLADAAIEEVDLVEQRDRRVREYSKGMRQRIKIAQALAHQPDILVLDEPLAGTDPVGRRHIIELIQTLGERGRTVIVSSHILHEVEQMTTDILLINKGRVVADGNIYRIRELIDEHPHTIFIDCSEPRAFASRLATYEDVVSIEFEEVGFRLATREPDRCYTRIPALALEHGIKIRRMTSPDNNLMAVFKYLVH
jgi:ABC-2 type transport system ATP-binding protein